jgi:hypothetical protein
MPMIALTNLKAKLGADKEKPEKTKFPLVFQLVAREIF